jgi:hypothetical protein
MTSVASQPPGYQPGYVPQGPPQGYVQQPQQPPPNLAPPPIQYHSATPLAVLGQGSSPADCPMCRHRAMTLTQAESGNTTQYVAMLIARCLMI